jgi:hypothetical protein
MSYALHLSKIVNFFNFIMSRTNVSSVQNLKRQSMKKCIILFHMGYLITHLSDNLITHLIDNFRSDGLLNCRSNGLLNCRSNGLLNFRSDGLQVVALMSCQFAQMSFTATSIVVIMVSMKLIFVASPIVEH